MKRLKILALALSCLFSISVQAQQAQVKLNGDPYKTPTPGQITIVASSAVPDGYSPDKAYYQDLVDCGFNVGMQQGSIDFFKQQFQLIGNLNFKYIISNDMLLNANRTKFIQAFRGSKYLAGWKFKDEPKAADLPDLKTKYAALVKDDPNTMVYMNLIGGLHKTFTGDAKSYAEYLQNMQKDFKPDVWSFDVYPISLEKGKIVVDYNAFFSDMEAYRNISTQTGRPFWSYCLSMAYKNKSYDMPAAKEEYLSFEAFTALAYGAQGIVYWTYALRPSTKTETYSSALVDMQGKKSQAWYAAQKVNQRIRKFNDVFYGCKVTDVKHTGRTVYKGTTRLTGAFGPFSKVTSANSGVLCSYIENNGQKYVVMVNHDVLNAQKVTLTLKSGKKVKDLDTDTEYQSGKAFSVSLPKGGVMIFRES